MLEVKEHKDDDDGDGKVEIGEEQMEITPGLVSSLTRGRVFFLPLLE